MLSKSKKTIMFLFAAVVLAASIFFYELVYKKKQEQAAKEQQNLIVFDRGDINYMIIDDGTHRIVLQKNLNGWFLLEPIQDKADQGNIETIVDNIKFQNSKKLNIDNSSVTEYKLDKPIATWTIKTSKGESLKILVSGEENFEGYPFIQVAGSENISLGNRFWKTTLKEPTTYFRHKKLIRSDIELVEKIRISALNNEFELIKKGQWIVPQHSEIALDQTKVKTFIMKLFDLEVSEYLSDGEPSQSDLKEKGLDKNFVQVEVQTGQDTWSARFQLDQKTNSLYGFTNRPTQLVKFDILKWELLANLNLDQFRDRSSVFIFDPNEVQKIFLKTSKGELEIERLGKWSVVRTTNPEYKIESEINADLLSQFLQDFSKTELNYFLEKSDYSKLTGTNMIILKTEGGQLLMQLNWGPQMNKKIFGIEKEFFLARTHQDPMVFGLAPETINRLVEFKFIKKEQNQ